MSSEILPFSDIRQKAFLGHVITNKTYYLQVKEKVKRNWFKDSWTGEAYGLYLKWSDINDPNKEKLPSVDEIQNSTGFIALTPDQSNKVRATIQQCIAAKSTFDWDSIVNELTIWLKCRIYLENVTKSTDHFNGSNYSEAFKLLEKSVIEYQKVKFFPDEQVDFSDWRTHFENSVTERQHALTTGLETLDKVIDPSCLSGCLLRGDTTILLAPSNLGKTTCMITMACANMKLMKKVLFITHEGRKEDIVDKFWSNITQKTKSELLQLYKTDERLFLGGCFFINKYLTYQAINDPAQLTVENVAAIIERKQQEQIAKDGQGFDLLVVDYPAKLTTEHSSKVNMQFRHAETYVYNYFVQLALKHKFHALLAIQANRESSKNNRFQGAHGTHNRLVTMEDVSESWGPMTVATNVLSINRNESYGDRVIYHLCKSRSSETGMSVLAKSDYTKATTHSNALGSLVYKGTTSVAEIDEGILNQYLGKTLPFEKVMEYEKE